MTVRAFDSFEEMQQAMRDGLDWGNDNLTPEQRAVSFGDHWADFRQIHDAGAVCFGYVWTIEENLASIRKGTDSAAEVEAELESTLEAHKEGMLFGKAYDRFNPNGEIGSTHRVHLWPISKNCWDNARNNGFVIDDMLPVYKQQLQEAFDAWRSHWNAIHGHGDRP
jgi:hypothetical protein